MHSLISRRSFGVFMVGGLVARPTRARALPVSQERTILTVSGRIGTHNEGDVVRFDRSMLETLGMQGFATTTPWYDGLTRFDGILMRTLLRSVAASGSRVIATALNDYTTNIPIADLDQYDVLLALKRNGAYMPVRDKGPLFIVYPFDSDKVLQSQTYYGRCAWQVSQLAIG